MNASAEVKVWGLALAGGILGAIVGHVVFKWVASQGFYALALPGAFVGWGASYFLRRRNPTIGAVAAGITAVVSIYSEWATAPFVADESLAYFVMHLHHLRPMTWIMILIGIVIGYSLGAGRDRAYFG